MRHYKASGFSAYNFAGINPKDLPSITRFKLSFGGEVVTLYDYMAAGQLALGAIRLREAARWTFQWVGVKRRVRQI
jgi:lipid II:glycine glycyltransferase (peptidoglycan interpeptide bridge formation enzyme)